MQTRYGGLSVLSVPIESCDRRALSQAWYSALHTQREKIVRRGPLHRKIGECGASVHPSNVFTCAPQGIRRPKMFQPQPPSRRLHALGPAYNRQSIRSTLLAARFERTFFSHAYPPRYATFILDGKARVYVVMRRLGQRVHIVALCSTAARCAVAQALDEVARRLRAHGLRLHQALV